MPGAIGRREILSFCCAYSVKIETGPEENGRVSRPRLGRILAAMGCLKCVIRLMMLAPACWNVLSQSSDVANLEFLPNMPN